MPEDDREKEAFAERLKVCLTGVTQEGASAVDGSFAIGVDEEDDADKAAFGESEEGIELEEQKKLLESDPLDKPQRDGTGLTTYAGRPNMEGLVNETFSHGHAEKVAIVVCGPKSLTAELRSHVGRWVKKGRDVWFWQESFAL